MPVGAGSWGNCNRLLQLSLLHLQNKFGYVKGQVASISPAPTEEGMYIVEITLPDGMQTNYGKQLPVSRELKGTADIILADKNVLERLLAPLRKVVEYEK